MEKAMNAELIKVLAVIFIGGLGAYMFLINLVKRIVGKAGSVRRKQNIYLIGAALVFGIVGITGHPAFFSDPVTFMLIYQVLFFGLGVLHLYLVKKWIPFPVQEKKSFWLDFVFTLVIGLFGCLLYVFAFRFFNRDGYHYIMATSIICFLVPLLIYQVFLKSVTIPPLAFKQWFYPVYQRVEEPEDAQLKNMFIVTFRFQKKLTDPYLTSFRAKAPANMGFGNLFYYFINDYNERNPEDKIEFLDERGNPQGWTFYKRGHWYTVNSKYIDADNSISSNGLKENDVIICHRLHYSAN
jgi:hypothetical protein